MKKNIALLLILLLMAGYIIIFSINSYQTLAEKNPVFKEKVNSRDVTYLYNFYLQSNPKTDNRMIYGNPDASITFTVVLDVTSDASGYFVKEILPLLKEEFIDTGKVKYYHKNYLTLEDIGEKTDRFKYSAALLCIESKEDYFNFFDEFKDATAFISKYNLSQDCNEDVRLREDAMEIENFGTITAQRFYIGIEGADSTVLDGVQSYAKFRRIIRNHQIIIGD
jgi:hypothetical protein|tara:strand:+ start:115 stop:783 length:669 start_codon:yes stop_codon:yes gene_type:complete